MKPSKLPDKHDGKIIGFFLMGTVVFIFLVITLHDKNWIWHDGQSLKILSGTYFTKLEFKKIDSVIMTNNWSTHRRNWGYSFMGASKGNFVRTRDKKLIRCYLDDTRQKAIHVYYTGEKEFLINLKKTGQTENLFELLRNRNENN